MALLSTGAPILLVCLARAELLSRRSEWPVTLRLEPLPVQAVAPRLVVDGPAPELEREVRELHRRLHGIPEGS